MKIKNTSASPLAVDGVGTVDPGEAVEVPQELAERLLESRNWAEKKSPKKPSEGSTE